MGKSIRYSVLIGLTVSIAVIYGVSVVVIGDKELSPEKYIKWVNDPDNGLFLSKEIDGVKYTSRFLPMDYYRVKYPNKISDLEDSKGKKSTLSFSFDFEPLESSDAILNPDIIGNQEYLRRLEYLNTQAQFDFKLVVNKDTIKCASFHYENPFSLNRNLKTLLDFEVEELSSTEDFTLIFEDNLFNGGMLKYNYSLHTINSIPKLKI